MFGSLKTNAVDESQLKARIGVLALQGAFIEHINIMNSIDGVISFPVKTAKDCENIDGLIIPGGESTTIGKLINIDEKLRDRLEHLVDQGLPIWGTCAGMILLSKKSRGGKFPDPYLLRAMDIEVTRNYFGPQTMSFTTDITVTESMQFEATEPLHSFSATFIRAPVASTILSDDINVLATIVHEGNKEIVAVEQGPFLGTSFHPELTADNRWHEWWVKERVLPLKEKKD